MGLFPIDCPLCKKPFLWFSGSLDQRCPDCQKLARMKLSNDLGVTLQPGDLIFYKANNTLSSKLIVWGQKIFKEMGSTPYPGFEHVAMVSMQNDLLIEMTWPHPLMRLIAEDQRHVVIMRPKVDPKIIERAIYWCYLNQKPHYSILSMVAGKLGLHRTYRYCSGWIDEAFFQSGVDLTGIDDLVSPNELASSPLLEKIYED